MLAFLFDEEVFLLGKLVVVGIWRKTENRAQNRLLNHLLCPILKPQKVIKAELVWNET